MENKYPKYVYRKSDYRILRFIHEDYYFINYDGVRLNPFEKGYSPAEILNSTRFKPCKRSDFKKLKKKHDIYTGYISWRDRPDGHGGFKDGTFEEYKRYRKILEKNKLKRIT